VRVFDRIGGDDGVRVFVGCDSDISDFFSWDVTIGHSSWEVYESSVDSAIELEKLLNHNSEDESRIGFIQQLKDNNVAVPQRDGCNVSRL
jgi:hypothetical protein